MTANDGQPVHRGRSHRLYYRLSLANKILVTTAALLILLGIAGTAVLQAVLRGELRREIASSTGLLAESVSGAAGEALDAGRRDDLDRIVRDTKALDPTISYVLIRDRDGRVLAHTFDWDPPAGVLAPPPLAEAAERGAYRIVRADGRAAIDVTSTIVADGTGAGFVQIGIGTERVARFIRAVNLVLVLALVGLTGLAGVVARLFYSQVTAPVVQLTRLADEVSVGNLDVRFDLGMHVRCWEIKRCERTDCTAYGDTTVQCWYVDGTPCEGYEPRFPQKLVGCRTCEVYQRHKGDEIVQLSDAFRHMTRVVRDHRNELERSDRFQRSLIHNSFDGIIATDEFDTVRVFNRVAQNLTGLSEEQVVGRVSWRKLFPDEVLDGLRQPLFQDGSKVVFGFYRKELQILGRDDEPIDVLASGISLREGGRQTGKVFFVRDMREIQRLRRELFRSERLAATGQTVASLSHSIKNILEGLRGGAYIYQRGVRIEDPAIRSRGWSMVERNIDHISELVADLLNFSRVREPQLRRESVNGLVQDVLSSLQPKAEAWGVELCEDLSTEVDPADIDAHALHQALSNLVSNAIDATADTDGARVLVRTALRDEQTVEIEVRDNGPGVPEEVVRELFTGMITTKGSRGTGLGLLVVHKIVGEHGGTVQMSANGPDGAGFRIDLPRVAADRGAADRGAAPR